WQAMMKKPDSKAEEAKKLADKFQDDIVRAMIAKKDVEEENEIIRAKALETNRKKKPANKPNEFITNDDFCPGCGLQLKALPEGQSDFWTEVFQRELKDSMDMPDNVPPERMGKPGLLVFRGWGLESRVGPTGQGEIAALRKDIEDRRKKLEPAL